MNEKRIMTERLTDSITDSQRSESQMKIDDQSPFRAVQNCEVENSNFT